MKVVSDLQPVKIDGNQLKQMLNVGAAYLEEKKKEIDLLNVFPVPDGDTGTNMFLTYRAAAAATENIVDNKVAEIASVASMGSLMGARGNSGVILSQIMRGIAKVLDGEKEASASQIAQALQMGSETAYKAVMKPVEGTILTVAKETGKAAVAKAKSGETSIIEVLKAGYEKGEEALARTPDMLPALKQAGVVDAGGKGFLTILSGWIAVLEGKAAVKAIEETTAEAQPVDSIGITEVGELEFPYCTEFLVKGKNISPDSIRHDLTERGDCLLVVGTEEVVKIHIHTTNPGAILDYALKWGSLHEVQISNMQSQNEAAAHRAREVDTSENLSVEPVTEIQPPVPMEAPARELQKYGIVAVAMGDGIAEIFHSLGVNEVVFGGQTMNPSTNDLAEAVRKIQAENIFILPNNKNIIMTAGQVNEIVEDKEVYVIPTKSIPQGISSLLGFNPDSNPEDNMQGMKEAISHVSSGEVTYAVRDSFYGDLKISEGDILGLVEGKICTTSRDILQVAKDVLEEMNWRDKELVTIFYGKDMSEEDVESLEKWLQSEKPDIEVEIYAGKQPLYYYVMGVE